MKEQPSKLIEVPFEAVNAVQDLLTELTADVKKQIVPIRKSILKRFPTLFLLVRPECPERELGAEWTTTYRPVEPKP